MSGHARWWATAGHETRRWAFYSLGARMCPDDLGVVHGPRNSLGNL